jgi:hypothetical protein
MTSRRNCRRLQTRNKSTTGDDAGPSLVRGSIFDSMGKVDLRIAVGSLIGPRSSIWRVFSNKDDVYIAHGDLGGIQKFSFHASGICRHAFTREEGPALPGQDRAQRKWRRVVGPTEGMVYALVARFPSDFLSSTLKAPSKPVRWITPAPLGQATIIEFVFTRLNEDDMRALAAKHGRQIIDQTQLPSGEYFVTSWVHEPWHGEPFVIPGVFGRDDQHVVSRHDPTGTGRPVRLSIFIEPTETQPMTVDEYGAYPAPLDTQFPEPMGHFSRGQLLKSSRSTDS